MGVSGYFAGILLTLPALI